MKTSKPTKYETMDTLADRVRSYNYDSVIEDYQQYDNAYQIQEAQHKKWDLICEANFPEHIPLGELDDWEVLITVTRKS